MSYTRQYTQGVGWENEPSTNTPISAENLNQMDNAILNIDEAVAAAFASSAGAINGYKITGLRNANSALYAGISYDDDISNHGGDIYVITSAYDVPEKSGGWQLHIEFSPSSSVNLGIRDCDGNILTSALPVGDIIICRLNINGSTRTVSLLAYIPAAGGGGSIKIWQTYSSSTAYNDGYLDLQSADMDLSVGDIVAVFINRPHTFNGAESQTSWGVIEPTSGMPIPHYNALQKISDGTSTDFDADLKRGDALIMVCTAIDPDLKLTVISSMDKDILLGAGGGGGGYDAAVIGSDVTPTSVYSSESVPIALTVDGFALTANTTAMVRIGKLTTIDYGAPGTAGLYFNINSTGAIPVYYNNTKVTGSSVFAFDANALYILLLRPIASQQYPWRFDIVGIKNTTQVSLNKVPYWGIIGGSDAGEPVTDLNNNLPLTVNSSFQLVDGALVFFKRGYNHNFYPFETGDKYKLNVNNTGNIMLVDTNNQQVPCDSFTFDDKKLYAAQYVYYVYEEQGYEPVITEFWRLIDFSGSGGGGSSTLAGLTDTNISSPTDKQPLTYDNATGKWINGGVIPIANGGTGNNAGYIRTGLRSGTTAGTGVTIEGQRNKATANYCHAEGDYNEVTANYAHAEGQGNKASGGSAHVEGGTNTASGARSHAGGNLAYAQAENAFAHGYGVYANGKQSIGLGQNLQVGYDNQCVVGKCNSNKSTNIFEVGIGTGTNARANGLELDTSGNLKTAGTITDGQGHVLGQPVVADGVWVISGETATLTVSTP